MARDILDLTRELGELGALLAELPDLDDFLEAGLAWLAAVAPYDLATIWQIDGDQADRLKVRVARGTLTSRKVLEHTVELGHHPELKRVLTSRAPRINTAHDHAEGEGDIFDGVLALLPGHSCMVAPLYAGERTLGLLSLDRNVCETYSTEVLHVVELFARLLAMGMLVTTQARRLTALYQEEKARNEILRADVVPGDPVSVLEATRNPELRSTVAQARAVAVSGSAVLIRGETGTGKEVMALALHRWSERHEGPFIRVNCAAIPEGMLESELFGHVKGAYTGAVREREGRFRAAHGGTLFLDEIGELSPALQAKLLRVLQEGTFEPVGSDRTTKVDVRILAATNLDLEEAIRKKTFREDLYYRINVFPLTLPPLAARTEDLPLLVEHFLGRFRQRTTKALKVGKAGMQLLADYPWPGNIRELGNVLERAVILATSQGLADLTPMLALAQLGNAPRSVSAASPAGVPVVSLDEATRRHIRQALDATGGKIYGPEGAAALLGLKPSTLQSKMKKLRLKGKA